MRHVQGQDYVGDKLKDMGSGARPTSSATGAFRPAAWGIVVGLGIALLGFVGFAGSTVVWEINFPGGQSALTHAVF